MQTFVKLLLLDDHALFRVMLSRLLETEPSFQVVAECCSTSEALASLAHQPIDLVLVDFDLGKKDTGFHFIRSARDAGYVGRIFIVTAGMSDGDYVRALGYGVCGIFLKHSSPELLIEAIHKVTAGETWIDQRCIQALAQAVDRERKEASRREFTDRERQVLEGVFSGLSNKEIGGQLHISEASVKSALQQLFLKTGVRTRSQLVRVVLEDYSDVLGSKKRHK